MKNNIKKIAGNWEDGYALDKHLIKSTFLGHNEFGHPQFDNERTEVGESVFQLKYRSDYSQAPLLAHELKTHIIPKFPEIGFVIPAPASNDRDRQPVSEVASELAKSMNIPCFPEFLQKVKGDGPVVSLKNIKSKDEKIAALVNRFRKNLNISGSTQYNALIIDDLFDSGATMEAICSLVSSDKNVKNVYVAALTWK